MDQLVVFTKFCSNHCNDLSLIFQKKKLASGQLELTLTPFNKYMILCLEV